VAKAKDKVVDAFLERGTDLGEPPVKRGRLFSFLPRTTRKERGRWWSNATAAALLAEQRGARPTGWVSKLAALAESSASAVLKRHVAGQQAPAITAFAAPLPYTLVAASAPAGAAKLGAGGTSAPLAASAVCAKPRAWTTGSAGALQRKRIAPLPQSTSSGASAPAQRTASLASAQQAAASATAGASQRASAATMGSDPPAAPLRAAPQQPMVKRRIAPVQTASAPAPQPAATSVAAREPGAATGSPATCGDGTAATGAGGDSSTGPLPTVGAAAASEGLGDKRKAAEELDGAAIKKSTLGNENADGVSAPV
jgi:hypothetical protein